MPKPNRDAIEQEEEIFNYLKQSHISATNTARLRALAASDDPRIAELAAIVMRLPRSNRSRRDDSRSWLESGEICSMPGEDGVDRCAPWLDQLLFGRQVSRPTSANGVLREGRSQRR